MAVSDVIPDGDGLVRIQCGGDVVEIRVHAGEVRGGFAVPRNPFDTPSTYLRVRGGEEGGLDLNRADAPGVVIAADALDVHAIARVLETESERPGQIEVVLDRSRTQAREREA